MLASSESDWCHGTLNWLRPKLITQLDHLLGFNKHRIKYSSFLFRRESEPLGGFRVITPAEKGPRGREVTLCGEGFFGAARIGKGHRSALNRPLEKAETYDRLLFPEGITTDIRSDTEVVPVSRM